MLDKLDTSARSHHTVGLLGMGAATALLLAVAGGYAGCGGGAESLPPAKTPADIRSLDATGEHRAAPAGGTMPVARSDGPDLAAASPAPEGEPSDAGIDGGPGDASIVRETDRLTVPTPLYDPSGTAMAPFYAALRRIEAEGATARIAVFGASHTAADFFTDVVRRRLQARFGDAGPGFVQVGKPWRWHRHAAVSYQRTRHYKTMQVRARSPRHERYGLGGVALESHKPWASAGFSTRTGQHPIAVDRIELFYLKQPRGGHARVLIDGKGARTLHTGGPHGPGYARFEVPLGPHKLEVRAHNDGPVRLFGAVLERSQPGVVLDTLGVPGSRARYHLYWDDAIYRAHLTRRNPDMVVLAYGTNEAGDDDVPIEIYEQRVRTVLKRIQEVAPQSACLLVGPSDRPIRDTEAGLISDRPRTGQLIASQKRLSAELGCAFFDVVAFMGGPLGMVRWVEARPPLGAPDHIHFTRRGYQAVGEALHDAIMADFVERPSLDPVATRRPQSP